MKKSEKSQECFGKKKINLVLIIVFSVVLVLSMVIICSGYKTNSINYLYPRIVNFKDLAIFCVIWVILTVAIVTLLFWKSKNKKTNIIRIILVLLLCTLLFAISFWISIWMNFDSYTENLDNYMVLDSEDFPLNELEEFFPEKEQVFEYQEKGFDIEYKYQFEYPFLYDCMEYDIKLSIDFHHSNAFDECINELSKNSSNITESNNEIAIIYSEYESKINGENVYIINKVIGNKDSNTVVFWGNLFVLE